jgi:hypothetical protein
MYYWTNIQCIRWWNQKDFNATLILTEDFVGRRDITSIRAGNQVFDTVNRLLAAEFLVWIRTEAFCFLFRKTKNASEGHPLSYSIRTGFSPHHSGRNVRVTSRFHLVSRLKMGGALSPLPPEAFLRFRGTTFSLCYLDLATAVSFQFLSTCSPHSSSLFTRMLGYSDTLFFRLYKRILLKWDMFSKCIVQVYIIELLWKGVT